MPLESNHSERVFSVSFRQDIQSGVLLFGVFAPLEVALAWSICVLSPMPDCCAWFAGIPVDAAILMPQFGTRCRRKDASQPASCPHHEPFAFQVETGNSKNVKKPWAAKINAIAKPGWRWQLHLGMVDFNSVSQAAPCHMSCQCVAKVCNRAQMH